MKEKIRYVDSLTPSVLEILIYESHLMCMELFALLFAAELQLDHILASVYGVRFDFLLGSNDDSWNPILD